MEKWEYNYDPRFDKDRFTVRVITSKLIAECDRHYRLWDWAGEQVLKYAEKKGEVLMQPAITLVLYALITLLLAGWLNIFGPSTLGGPQSITWGIREKLW